MSIIFAKKCKRCGIESNTGSWDVCANCQPFATTEKFCVQCGRKREHTPECAEYIPNTSEIQNVAEINETVSAENIADNYIQNRQPKYEAEVRNKIISTIRKYRDDK